MPSVYIETTIPSFYFETRQSATIESWREATRRWWDHYRRHYQLVTSELVLLELAAAPGPKASAAKALLQDVPLLEPVRGLDEVIDFYIQHRLMPAGAGGDAAHLAFASLHSIDFLLTWNCRHLANANKLQHLRVLNARLGISTPTIATPFNLEPEN
jgi:hypothetical protein